MRHECQADDRNMNETSCPAGMNIGQLDKGSGDCRLRVDMQDSVIMMESARAGDAFAAGTYRNVTLVWAGRGPWPGAPLPAGVNLTTNRANYERAKTSWLRRHGCDPSGNNCRYLQHDKINQTPPALTRPFVQMINWPRLMTAKDGGGNGSGIQWWASGEQFTPGAAKTGSQHIKLVQPGTVDFRLSCTGSNGISVSDATRGIWIAPRSSRETNKPSVPSMVQAVPALGKINVKWDESRDDSGIASYRIYRDGEWITSVSGSLSFADRDIIGNRTYSYQIEAFDVFGNLSGLSLRAQARTGAR